MVAAARQTTSDRRALIAKLHVAKRDLGLDEELYRDALEAATGKRSAADMSEAELAAALEHFRARGFDGTPPSRGRADAFAQSVYLPKVRALWIAGWHLGVVRDRTDAAMAAFIRRQTGLDAAAWLNRHADAAKVIEGLKSWLAREAGVAWGDGVEGVTMNPRKAVVWAQFRRLVALGDFAPFSGDLHRSDIEAYGFRVTGKPAFLFYTDEDWDALIRAAGARLRRALARHGGEAT